METVDGAAVGVPVRLGKYTLLTRLATGGMGEVYVAQMSGAAGFAKQVVIKRILPQLAQDEQFVQMFLDEARITAQLNHPNICQVFELGEIANEYFISMEYLEGLALSKLFDKHEPGSLELRIVAGLMAQACEGLAYAHEFSDPLRGIDGVVHRDVSPQNLFVTTAGLVKVLDFGVAKLYRPGSKTVTHSAKGKHLYMSPEQVRGEAVDHRSDIFALGVVLFEAITGQRARIEDLRADVPTSVSEVVERALHLDRAQRYDSARDLAEALTRAVEPLGGAASITDLAKFVRRDHTSEISAQRDRIRRISAQMRAVALPPELLDEGEGAYAGSPASPAWSRSPIAAPSAGTQAGTRTPRRDSAVMHAQDRGRRASSITDATKSDPGSGERLSGVSSIASFADGAGIDPARSASISAPQRGYARWGILIGAALAVALWFGHRALTSSAAGPTITSRPMATAASGSATPESSAEIAGKPSSLVQPARAPLPVLQNTPDHPAPVHDQAPAAAAAAPPTPASTDAVAEPESLQIQNAGSESTDAQRRSRHAAPGAKDKGAARMRNERGRRGRSQRGRNQHADVRRAVPEREPGYLTIDASPYAEIYVDGNKMGITPLVRVPLTVGQHTIRAVSKNGDAQRLLVRIKPGETVSRRVRFSTAKR